MRVFVFVCLIALGLAADPSPNSGPVTAEIISAGSEPKVETPTTSLPEPTPELVDSAQQEPETAAPAMEVEPRDPTPKQDDDNDKESFQVTVNDGEGDDELPTSSPAAPRLPEMPELGSLKLMPFPNMMLPPFNGPNPFNLERDDESAPRPFSEPFPHPPFNHPLPLNLIPHISPFPINFNMPHMPHISLPMPRMQGPIEVISIRPEDDDSEDDAPVRLPSAPRPNPILSLFDALKPIGAPSLKPIHLSPFHSLFGGPQQIHPMSDLNMLGFHPIHLNRPLFPFGGLRNPMLRPEPIVRPPPQLLNSILDSILSDVPPHIQELVESKHDSIPSEHAQEPMVPKLEAKDDYYIITGWFPGVKKEDLKMRLEGSEFVLTANVTAKDDQTMKDLGQFSDIDVVDERIDLPYAPDSRFMKARFDEDKHSLTVVFPKEKTSEIQLM